MKNEKKRVRSAIQEWYEKEIPKTLPRDVDINNLVRNNFIIDILGSRRSGKTYLMYRIIDSLKREKNIIYINFEDRKLWPLSDKTLDEILNFIYEEGLIEKHKKIYLFLDEIQHVPNWERFVRNIYDDFKEKIKIFISGSSSKIGKKETSTLLTGRHLSLIMFPLSFKEFLIFKNVDVKNIEYSQRRKAKLLKLLREYLEFGGFPEVVLSNQKVEILSQYYTDIIYRDIVERYGVRETNVVENLTKYLITNIGTKFSYWKTAKYFQDNLKIKVSTASIRSYTKHLEEVFFIFSVPIFSYKIKDQMQYPRKMYCIDVGLRNAVSFKFSEDIGRLAENIVFIELKRRRKEVYYWKNKGEVDFVIKEGLKPKELIQVCWDVEEPKTKEREVKALLEAMKEFKLKHGVIITEDYEGEEKIKGKKIKFKPLWKWLLKL